MNDKERHEATILAASQAILKDYYLSHKSDANRDKLYTIYSHSTLTPDDALDSVKVVEAAIKENILAKAQFHAAEAERFQWALKRLGVVV